MQYSRQLAAVLCTVLCITFTIAVIAATGNAEHSPYFDAVHFVRAWNHLAEAQDNLTLGVKINARPGWHTVTLEDDTFLRYHVAKTGIFQRTISVVSYESPCLRNSDAAAAVSKLLSSLLEGSRRDTAHIAWKKQREQIILLPTNFSFPNEK